MKTLLKYFKWVLLLLTVILVGYLLSIFFFHDTAFYLNETYGIYIIIQVLHIAVSLTALFVIWSSHKFDNWAKIDQSLLVLFLSVIGLWIWYGKYKKEYLESIDDQDRFKEEL